MDMCKYKITFWLFCLLPFLTINAQSNYCYSNPILQATAFIPDGEPHIFDYHGERRVFVYGSRDERIKGYCGFGHDVWSAPVTDLSKWTNHGEIFNVKQVKAIGYGWSPQQHFGAPDCAYNPVTKKYYLYTFLGAGYKLSEEIKKTATAKGYGTSNPICVMAESASPAGPFLNPVMCDWPPVNNKGAFDPAVLVDPQPDGSVRVFAYWGMVMGDCCAELDPHDMHTIINPETRLPDRNAVYKTLAPEKENHGSTLFEASSIRKVADGKYVFIYSPRERPSVLTYAYGNSPLGPFKFGGRIVDNNNGWRGGNNHGSIVNVDGQWYAFYHRHTAGGINRQAMMQPIELSIIGDSVAIPTIPLLSQATPGNGLNPFQRYNISVCCYRKGKCSVLGAPREPDGLQPLINVFNGELLGIKYFDFGQKGVKSSDRLAISFNARLLQDASITILYASKGSDELKEIDRIELKDQLPVDDNYHEACFPLDLSKIGKLQGTCALYFRFESKSDQPLCEIKELELSKRGKQTPNPLQTINVSSQLTDVKVSTIPTKARVGESVKILLQTEHAGIVNNIKIRTKKGKEIKVYRNAVVPFAPISYHFEMPNDEVFIDID